MDDGEDAPLPQVLPPPRPVYIRSLRETCINTLSQYRACLGDLGWVEAEDVRAIIAMCTKDQLAQIEDETLEGSQRDLSWYTWHVWRRIFSQDLGNPDAYEVPPLETDEPEDYVPPRGVDAEPGDYRRLYAMRQQELADRAAAAKERIAAAYQQVEANKEGRKAKMIDALMPAKRRLVGATPAARAHAAASAASAFAHKPRSDSRSSLMAKPGGQLKLLKELGLVKKGGGAPKPVVTRVVRPAAAPAARGGGLSCSSMAGAQLVARASGVGAGAVQRGGAAAAVAARSQQQSTVELTPAAAARAAAVAAARAAGSSGGPGRPVGAAGPSSGASGAPVGSRLLGGKRPGEGDAGGSPGGAKAARVGPGGGPGTIGSRLLPVGPPGRQGAGGSGVAGAVGFRPSPVKHGAGGTGAGANGRGQGGGGGRMAAAGGSARAGGGGSGGGGRSTLLMDDDL